VCTDVLSDKIIDGLCTEDVFINKNTDYSFCSSVIVEQIYTCVQKLHLHKASGPDDLVAKYVKHVHPSLIIHSKL
jgi:hypothetical protein